MQRLHTSVDWVAYLEVLFWKWLNNEMRNVRHEWICLIYRKHHSKPNAVVECMRVKSLMTRVLPKFSFNAVINLCAFNICAYYTKILKSKIPSSYNTHFRITNCFIDFHVCQRLSESTWILITFVRFRQVDIVYIVKLYVATPIKNIKISQY